MDPTRGDPRYNLNYSMGLSLADQADLYGNPGVGLSSSGGGGGGGRPPSVGLIQSMGGGGRSTSSSGLMGHGGSSGSGQCQTLGGGGGGGQARGIKRTSSDCYDDHHRAGINSQQLQGLDGCGGNGNNGGNPSGTGGGQTSGNIIDVVDDNNYNTTTLQNKKSPPANGKKTKGRVKIKMEYIDNKLRRYTTFSKRKTGIMKKAYELSTLTGTQVMLLVASETGHVYTFATRKLQPMITSEAGKQLIQTCLNSPDPPTGGSGGDQRMSATGFEETELSYNIADEDSKDDRSPMSSINDSDESSDIDSPGPPPSLNNSQNILPESTILEHPNSLNLHSSQIQVTNPTSSSSTSSSHYDAMKTTSTLAHLSGIGNVLYPPSALANIPQEVLLGLVQSGHLQLHTEEDGGHQFITIPLSMTSTATGGNSRNSNNSSTSSTNTVSGGNGGLQTSQIGTSNNGGSSSNKNHKDLSIKVNPSSSVLTSNGRESSPIEIIRIKKEIIE